MNWLFSNNKPEETVFILFIPCKGSGIAFLKNISFHKGKHQTATLPVSHQADWQGP